MRKLISKSMLVTEYEPLPGGGYRIRTRWVELPLE